MSRLIPLLLVLLLLVNPTAGDPTTITFEEWPDGSLIDIPYAPATLITDEFQEWGVIFQNSTQIHDHGHPGDLPTPPNCLFAASSPWLPDQITLDAYFVCPANPSLPGTVPWVEITQDKGAQSGGGILEAYDLSGNLVQSLSFNTSGATFRVEYPGIHRVFIGPCRDDLDNFAFGDISCIPVPGAALIGALGLSFGGWLLRKRGTR